MSDLTEQFAGNAKRVDHFGVFRLFHEPRDATIAIRGHDAESGDRLSLDWDRSDGEIRAGVDMLADHLAVIHAVELVSAEDDEIFATVLEEIPHVLTNRIRRALIPPGAFRRLLGGEDVHEAGSEIVELIALVDVRMQRGAVELSENVNPAQAGVQAVADRDVHQTVFAAERNGRLRALFGEWKKT